MSFSMLSKPEAASWTAFSSALVVKLLMLSFRLQPVVMRSTAIVGAITPWEEEKEKMEGCKRERERERRIKQRKKVLTKERIGRSY